MRADQSKIALQLKQDGDADEDLRRIVDDISLLFQVAEVRVGRRVLVQVPVRNGKET